MWAILIFALIGGAKSQECKNSILCDEGICKTTCGPTDCEKPDGKECNGTMLPLYDNPNDICSCCFQSCVKHLELDSRCESVSEINKPTDICGPGLACVRSICKPMDTLCVNQRKTMNTEGHGMNQIPPTCDDEGYYAPLQCYPGGLCRCVDKDTGEPLAMGFGVVGGRNLADSTGMDCRCALQYHETYKMGCRMSIHFSNYATNQLYLDALHECYNSAWTTSAMPVNPDDSYFGRGQMRCLPNGNFDPLQCVDRDMTNGMCLCVAFSFGQMILNSTLAPREETEELNCFDATIHYSGYYRPCERIVYETKKAMDDYAKKGQNFISNKAAPVCNPDGYFYRVQSRIDDVNSLFCSNKFGEVIETFVGSRSTLSGRKMNCECATTRNELSDSLGSVKPRCCPNGNFESLQCFAGLCYCVDKYGRQIGMEIDQSLSDTLDCYDVVKNPKYDYCCDQPPESYKEDTDFCYEKVNT